MPKLLAVLLLALGSTSALAVPDSTFKEWIKGSEDGWLATEPPPPPGSVEPVFGGKFYLVDPDAPVEFTFVTSHAGHDLIFSVASVNSSGTVGAWQTVFTKTGNSVASTNYFIDPRELTYHATGSELLFRVYDKTTAYTYYNGVASNNPDNAIHTLTYYDYYQGKTLVGFEDLYADVSDWDYDDLVFLVNNVSSSPIPAPEPNIYVMMLAGFGLLGAVARKRRAS